MPNAENGPKKIKVVDYGLEKSKDGIYRSVPIVFELTEEQFARREERRKALEEQINNSLREDGINPDEIR